MIYIVRNPLYVIDSFQKRDIEQPIKHWIVAAFYYLFVNLLCRATLLLLRNKISICRIKYEDFVNNTFNALTYIEDNLDLNLAILKQKIKNKDKMIVGNLFDGNRIRQSKSIEIKGVNKRKKKSRDVLVRFFTLFLYR